LGPGLGAFFRQADANAGRANARRTPRVLTSVWPGDRGVPRGGRKWQGHELSAIRGYRTAAGCGRRSIGGQGRRHTCVMRQAFAHQAILVMEPAADVRAPGAAVTVALCGHWDHQPPCPLAPHYVSTAGDHGQLRVRTLFAAEPDQEGEVRHLIEQALSGQLEFPDGFAVAWRLRASWSSEVSAEEADNAERLIRS
jgi:hypothetical protein